MVFLYRSRPGLVLRAVGDNHVSAHALGYPVLKIRTLASIFAAPAPGSAAPICRSLIRRSSSPA